MAGGINTHEEEELAAYFTAHLRQGTWWENLLGYLDTSQDIDLDLGKFKIPLPLRLIRPFSTTVLMRSVAKRWVRPTRPHPRYPDLSRLRTTFGFSDLTLAAFAQKLRDQCTEIQHEHAPMARWVQRQIALADLASFPPPEKSSELTQAAIALRNGNHQAVGFLSFDPVAAINLADEISRSALRAAGLAVCTVFGGECHFSANLMIPVPSDSPLPKPFPHSEAASVRARADELWKNIHSDRRLIIVSETERAGHLGFWVPTARGSHSNLLPGAPRAFLQMSGNAVFKDDLPKIEGFPEEVGNKWTGYMEEHFAERLFVSLPLLVPASTISGTGSAVAAVVNINASPQNEELWYRAYHEEWLKIAQNRVADLAEIAFYAMLVKVEAETALGTSSIRIDTGCKLWDRLPVAEVIRRLPAGSPDE
jgi:hypothetical protein